MLSEKQITHMLRRHEEVGGETEYGWDVLTGDEAEQYVAEFHNFTGRLLNDRAALKDQRDRYEACLRELIEFEQTPAWVRGIIATALPELLTPAAPEPAPHVPNNYDGCADPRTSDGPCFRCYGLGHTCAHCISTINAEGCTSDGPCCGKEAEGEVTCPRCKGAGHLDTPYCRYCDPRDCLQPCEPPCIPDPCPDCDGTGRIAAPPAGPQDAVDSGEGEGKC